MNSRLVPVFLLVLSSCLIDIDPDATRINYKDVTSVVGPAGGTIKFRSQFGEGDFNNPPFITITVPAGALDTNTSFAVTGATNQPYTFSEWNADSTAILSCCYYKWSLKPQDIVFKNPVKVNFSMTGSYQSTSPFWYREPGKKSWKQLASKAAGEISMLTTQLTDFGTPTSSVFPGNLGNPISINSTIYVIEQPVAAASPNFITTFGTWRANPDVSNGVKRLAKEGNHSIKFLSFPVANSFGQASKTYDIYNSYANSTPNTNTNLVELKSNLSCTDNGFANCDTQAEYVGLSGKIVYYKGTNVTTNTVVVHYITYTNVILKSKLTGKEIRINGTVGYI